MIKVHIGTDVEFPTIGRAPNVVAAMCVVSGLRVTT